MIPATTERIAQHTPLTLSEELQGRLHDSVRQYAGAPPALIERRLGELNREWDTDRLMETVCAGAVLLGIGLAAVSYWWLLLAGAAAVSLFSHALFGWDPLLALYRRSGFRTSTEIDYERYALKGVRGDFQKLTGFTTPDDREAIARLEGEGGPAWDAPPTADAADPHVVREAVEAARK